MSRLTQAVLIVSILCISWLGMMAIHEAGHALAASLTGGTVMNVVVHPLTISRTDVSPNPHPLIVVWMGPLVGVAVPLAVFGVAALVKSRHAYLPRFFAGFCSIANGAYIGVGAFERVGDAGDMLRLGTPIWLLWIFGIATVPLGLFLWHGQGRHFGWGIANGEVDRRAAWGCFALALALTAFCVWMGN